MEEFCKTIIQPRQTLFQTHKQTYSHVAWVTHYTPLMRTGHTIHVNVFMYLFVVLAYKKIICGVSIFGKTNYGGGKEVEENRREKKTL